MSTVWLRRVVCFGGAALCGALAVYLDGIPNWRVLLVLVVGGYWLFAWNALLHRVDRLERAALIRTPIDTAGLFQPITRVTDADTGEVYAIRQVLDSANEETEA